MKLIITNKIERIDLDSLMEVYAESNRENLEKFAYKNLDDLENAYKEYLSKDFLNNKDNYLAILSDGKNYLAALRLHREDGGYLIEAIETREDYRKKGYGFKLLSLVIDWTCEDLYLRSEVGEDNIKSIGLHKKLGFKIKEKIGKSFVFIRYGQKKKAI